MTFAASDDKGDLDDNSAGLNLTLDLLTNVRNSDWTSGGDPAHNCMVDHRVPSLIIQLCGIVIPLNRLFNTVPKCLRIVRLRSTVVAVTWPALRGIDPDSWMVGLFSQPILPPVRGMWHALALRRNYRQSIALGCTFEQLSSAAR